jgi:hypothetical protein
VAHSVCQVWCRDQDPHRRTAGSEHLRAVGLATDADQFDERVDSDLLDRALVLREVLGACLLGRSTNRGPLRRGDVAASTAEVTSAADSGSSRPVMRVMPSAWGIRCR